MRRNNLTASLLLVLIATSFSSVAADTELLRLNTNPFARPDSLKRKPPAPPTSDAALAGLPPEEIELELTATLVSENVPMVIVNGELLAIGEKIGKMKLIAVMEGKAIFVQAGKRFSFEIDGLELK